MITVLADFLSGTLANTPILEYLVVSWVGTGILELVIGVYIVLYMAPKGVDKMVAQGIKEAKHSPEIAPFIDKLKEIITVFEPIMKQAATALKNIDIEKTQKDLQPLMNALKGIDPAELNALIKNLKELTGMVTKTLEKHETPSLPPLPEPECRRLPRG